MKYRYGSDKNPSGMMKVYGCRPGFLEPYGKNCYDDMAVTSVTFTTTHKSIQQILPPPLEPDRDNPPVVAAVLLEANVFRALNGENVPYWELGLWMPAKFRGVTGMHTSHLYIDGPGGFASCLLGRDINGIPKETASIERVWNDHQVNASAVQLGVQRIAISANCPDEATDAASLMSAMTTVLNVKEIPNCTFTGYDVRKVIACDWDFLGKPKSARVGTGTVTLGAPFDMIDIVEIGPAYHVVMDCPADTLNRARELADLLKS